MPIFPLLKVCLIKTYASQISISSLFHQALCSLASGHSLYTGDLEAGYCHGYSLLSDGAYVTFFNYKKFAVKCAYKLWRIGTD